MSTACIFGVGGIGGYLAAKLAQSGLNVTGISRGAQLQALQSKGLTLIEQGRPMTVRIRAVERTQDAGEQEVVFLTVKSNALPAIAADMRPLLKAGTAVITAGNGFPWWYFHRAGAAGVAPTLPSVDPRGALWRLIGPEHAIGCVVYPAARIVEPGVIEHVYGNRFSIGEPDGSLSERIQQVAAMLKKAGLDAPVRQDIRTELWTKLVANVAYNPVSVLTGATLGQMINDVATSNLLEVLMTEAIAVAAGFGVKVPLQPRQLMELTRPLAAHKTSMLQDLEARRAIEIDPVVAAVAELARLKGMKTPVLDTVLTLTRQRARLAGCYGAPPSA
jgi:2-dehydropantoate 2-reductase